MQSTVYRNMQFVNRANKHQQLSVSDFRGHGRRVAIHDRLAAVIEALWSHLLVTAAQSLALGWIWVSVVQEAVNPPQ